MFTLAELAQLVADADELAAAGDDVGRQYVSVLKDVPTAETAAAVEAHGTDLERAYVRGRAVHLLVPAGTTGGPVGAVAVEKLLGVATNRNVTVMRAVAARWCGWTVANSVNQPLKPVTEHPSEHRYRSVSVRA